MKPSIPFLLAAAGLLAVVSAASAADYAVSVKTYSSSGCCEDQAAGTLPVSISGSLGHPTGYYNYYATSNSGTAYMSLANYSWMNSGLLDGKQASANVTYYDLFLTDGTGVPKNVTIWVNLQVEGSASYSAGTGTLSACASAGTIVGVNPPQSQSAGWGPQGGLWTCGGSSGPFAGWNGNAISGTFAFGPFLVPTEQLNALQLTNWLIAAPDVGWLADYINVFSSYRIGFPTLTAAITTPAGVTASSVEAGIVDGWYVGNASTGAPSTASGAAEPHLLQNAPNPFRDATTIRFALGERSPVSLRVLDVTGRLVADLAAGERAAGSHTVTWDGRDAAGRRAPAGIYFYRLERPGAAETRRMTLLR